MSSNAWLFWALASAGFASLTAIFAKMGLHGIDSYFATFIRTLVILAALVLFLTYTGLATGASWLAYFKALQLGNASQVAPVDKFSLVLVALMAVVFLDERPSMQEWIGLGMVTVGVLTIAFKR